MKAIPVTRPATIIDVLQPEATLPASKKKKAVVANIAIEITQNEIPTKSSDANIAVSAFATPESKNLVVSASNKPEALSKSSLDSNIIEFPRIFCLTVPIGSFLDSSISAKPAKL